MEKAVPVFELSLQDGPKVFQPYIDAIRMLLKTFLCIQVKFKQLKDDLNRMRGFSEVTKEVSAYINQRIAKGSLATLERTIFIRLLPKIATKYFEHFAIFHCCKIEHIHRRPLFLSHSQISKPIQVLPDVETHGDRYSVLYSIYYKTTNFVLMQLNLI